ncbi:MAG: 4'-phosphopantetheinyl transferase superfamily protein [Lachnospiraceae bacterium]
MQIYIAKTYELTAEEEERLCELLDRDRIQRVAEIRSRKERARSIFAGLLLRYAFLQAGYEAAVWRQAKIGRESYGKPYIIGISDFHYGLSHSGDWVACAADTAPVGIDLQEMRPWKLTLAKRFYHEEEYKRLLALDGAGRDRQTEEFYSMWTAKESAVKLNGRGIGAGISRYVTAADYSCICDMDRAQTYDTRRYDIQEGYMLCVCSGTNLFPEFPERVDWENMNWENSKMEGNRC